MISSHITISSIALACFLTSSLSAQFATFNDETSARLSSAPGVGSADPQEKDYAWDDLDQDGDIDLVCVRKQPFTTTGRHPNVLFMNENGVLTDRTSTLASASTVAGSQGFLDATNDRDVVIVDVNGDGWKDVVTATTLSAGLAQYIRVPRVYINQGNDGTGTWLGLLFDDETRIDDIANGWQGVHRFCSISAGDVDGDGDADLYFGDYQQGGARAIDINDRLLINDGTGYFTDESSTRMSVTMLESSFAMSTAMVDMNGDGKVDILKDDALNAPQGVSISYNDGTAGTGFFGSYEVVHNFAPYHINTGDLNNDGLPDLVISDDGQDRFLLHSGVVGGMATFRPASSFSYTGGGSDDGFAGNNLIADLNNDGWNDVLITDVDVDIAGFNRRTHIFRNLGNAPDVTLQEQTVNGAIAGIPIAMLRGTHDVAVFDIDGDGWKDMVMGRSATTEVWMNDPPTGLVFSYPAGLQTQIAPGNIVTLEVAVTGLGGVTPVAGSGQLFYSVNGAPFQSKPLRDEGPGLFSVKLPPMIACADEIRYYVTCDSVSNGTYNDPPTAPTSFYEAIGATGTATIYEEHFEGTAPGWSVVNTNISTGAWQVAVPNGTTTGGQFAAPPEDAEAGVQFTSCFVTQNGPPGGPATSSDVDGGPTDLFSPPIDLDGTDGFISYSRWFFSSGTDTLEVSISPNGITWTNLETVASGGTNQWTVKTFRVSEFITPSSTVQVRFRTADQPNNSVTEAAIDLFRVDSFLCECAPICQLNIGLMGPGTALLAGLTNTPPIGSPSVDLLVQGAPPFAPGWVIGSFDLDPTPAVGGTLISMDPFAVVPFVADAAGTFGLYGLPSVPGPFSFYAQGIYLLPGAPFGVGITNGLRVDFP